VFYPSGEVAKWDEWEVGSVRYADLIIISLRTNRNLNSSLQLLRKSEIRYFMTMFVLIKFL
jgi:hypothetical protein